MQEVSVVTITNEECSKASIEYDKLLQTCSALPKSIRDLARVILVDHLSFLDPAMRKMSR